MRTIAGLLALSALVGCMGASVPPSPQPTPLGAPKYEQFEKTVTQYPYHASRERTKEIRGALARAKPCMTKAEVRALFGTPDYGYQSYSKGPHPRWQGSSWTYVLFLQDEEPNELLDARVEIFFATDDRAHWIVPTQIDNAKEIGAVGIKCSQPSS